MLFHTCDVANAYHTQRPTVASLRERVVLDGLRGEVRHEFFVFEFVERKAVAAFCHIVEVGDIGHHAGVHLHLYAFGSGKAFFLDVGIFKIHALYVALGDDVGAEHE